MLNYNTMQQKLVLPEYGRNIQRMVDHCLSLSNRDERTACAHAIIRSMGNLFPELRAPENEHKLWDHLMIMSGFTLDIDFPCNVIKAEDLETPPQPMAYSQEPMKYRHYGKIIQQMIDKAADMEPGAGRDSIVMLIANHMKKQMLAVNPDGVDDTRIFKDLCDLSHGVLRLDSATSHLHEFKEMPVQNQGKKKKKKG